MMFKTMRKNKTYPLSLGQERIWFEEQIEPGMATYNVAYCYRVRGALNLEAVKKSLRAIVERHEILRTTFSGNGDQCIQVVGMYDPAMFTVIDCRDLPQADRLARALAVAANEARVLFDLRVGPPLRLKVLQLADDDVVLSLTLHHIVCDGWSMPAFFRELSEIYQATLQGKEPSLPELPIQYGEYAVWQRKQMEGDSARKHAEYFRQFIGQRNPTLNLPADYVRPHIRHSNGSTYYFSFDPALFASLEPLRARHKVTRFMLLLAAFKTLLLRYTGQDDLIVGAPVAGRVRPDTFDSIGFFVNTLILRTAAGGDPTFLELLSRVRETTLQAINHQEFPFEELVRVLKVERDLSRTPLFQVMLVQDEVVDLPRFGDASVERIYLSNGGAKCDLTLFVTTSSDPPRGHIEYSTELFEEKTIRRLKEHFEQLLKSVADDPGRRLSELPILTPYEQQQILVDWNATDRGYPRERCIHELFEERAESKGEQVALVCGDRRVTYEELNRRSNQLAHRLQKMGVRPEVVVGLCVDRSVDMVVGMLGILKAGGAYLPLDPEYPHDRVRYILEESRIGIVVSETRFAENVRKDGVELVLVDREKEEIEEEEAGNPEAFADPRNLSYVLYTSGSTGKPKGVAVEHRNTVAFLSWAAEELGRESLDGMLASTSVSFDLSVLEILLPLCFGGKAILVKNALYLLSAPEAREVQVVNAVPSVLKELLDSGGLPPSVHTVMSGGDQLHPSLAEKLLETVTVRRLFNAYGPTETTTYSTCARVLEGKRVTIGRPISNTTVYVLDQHLKPVPIGVFGEIFIGGAGVARGYYNRPDLTSERFVPDPYSRTPNARLYRTGDIGRFLDSGEIECIGRSDSQVKLRGFRIEVGEIESVLASHAAVREVAVWLQEHPSVGKYLVAYCVVDDESDQLRSSLLSLAKRQLPAYMIPSTVVFLKMLPKTPNGKIDRKALPDPGVVGIISPEDAVDVSMSETETRVAAIWAGLFKRQSFARGDNFFDVGGHSLLALRLVSRIHDSWKVEVPLIDIFDNPTIEGIASLIDQLRHDHDVHTARVISRV